MDQNNQQENLKGASQLVDFIHHLKCAHEYMQSFKRDRPGTRAEKLAHNYGWRIEWIYNDMMTNPTFPPEVREGIRKEWNSDTFTMPAIMQKVAILNPQQRDAIENVLDTIIRGESLQIDIHEGNSHDANA